MKLLWDLRGCQRWRERGIPRYIQNLAFAVAEKRPDYEFTFLYEREFPKAIWDKELMKIGKFQYVDEVDKSGHFDWFLLGSPFLPASGQLSSSEYLIPAGWTRKGTVARMAAIAYDFIPWRLRKEYLASFEQKTQYVESLDLLRSQDLLLTISEDTAKDAGKLFPDFVREEKIVNLNGGVGTFKGLIPSLPFERELGEKFGVQHGRYWIYIGGDDPRKNLEGLLRAQISRLGRTNTLPLLVVCSLTVGRKRELQRLANRLGGKQIIRFTGFVPDEELWPLLRGAYGMVFPSLYEGLGLPVLESYSVGTPVLCSEGSSLGSLAPKDFQFDPRSSDQIAERMSSAENSGAGFREKSLVYWKSISQEFSWRFAAQRLIEAFDTPVLKRPHPSISKEIVRSESLTTWVCSLPPASSGVAVFTGRVLEHSEAPRSYVAYINDSEMATQELDQKHSVLSVRDLKCISGSTSTMVFVLGNSEHHVKALQAMSDLEGSPHRKIVYLHDGNLTGLWLMHFTGNFSAFSEAFKAWYPELASDMRNAETSIDFARLGAHGLRPLFELFGVSEFITHSSEVERMLREEIGTAVRVSRLFLPIESPERQTVDGRVANSVLPAAITVGTFGIASPMKGSKTVLEACRLLRKSGLNIRLLYAGYNQTFVKKHLRSADAAWVELHEGVEESELQEQMRRVDVAVQLRDEHYGEASGVVCELLGMGKPIVCTDIGWFKDMKHFLKLAPTGVTPAALAAEIRSLLAPGSFRPDQVMLEKKMGFKAYWARVKDILGQNPSPATLSDT